MSQESFAITLLGTVTQANTSQKTITFQAELAKLLPVKYRERRFVLTSSCSLDLSNVISTASNFLVTASGFSGKFKNIGQLNNSPPGDIVLGVAKGFGNVGTSTNYNAYYTYQECNATEINYPDIFNTIITLTELNNQLINITVQIALSLQFRLIPEE